MKLKLLAITVLFTWIFQIGFPYLSYEIRRKECWQEFLSERSTFSPDEIREFVLENTVPLNWERDRQEFSLDGKFYDVLKVENRNGQQVVCCVADEDEPTLLNSYENFLKRHHQEKARLRLKKSNYFFQAQNEFSFPGDMNRRSAFNYLNVMTGIFSEVSSPPPKMMI